MEEGLVIVKKVVWIRPEEIYYSCHDSFVFFRSTAVWSPEMDLSIAIEPLLMGYFQELFDETNHPCLRCHVGVLVNEIVTLMLSKKG